MNMFQKLQEKSRYYRRNKILSGRARIFSALIVSLGVFDILSTNIALMGPYKEGNLLVGNIMDFLGSWWAFPKLLWHIATAALVLWMPSSFAICLAILVCLIYFGILANNFYKISLIF